ncbi:MAG: hypothetical protein L6V91_02690 [Bacilli bacterium]|nr:MAG: hypothetical protein L6V91_02690 [Bacilli bacterium]
MNLIKKLDLTLSTEQIDEIINRDYTNGEKWEHVLKTYINKDGKEHSYWTIEKCYKKESKRNKKRLVKKVFFTKVKYLPI